MRKRNKTMAYSGKFIPMYPEKYIGNPSNIVYRSLWEAKFFRYADSNKNVLRWSSEEIIIPYYSPVDKKMHRYFPDVYVEIIRGDGSVKKLLIEIKPDKQTKPPNESKKFATKTGRMSRRYINEVKTYAVNSAKWEAAKEFCLDRGWEFVIFTEKELGVR